MKLLGLSGYAGCGKDTVAASLVDIGWIQLALADPMKEFCQELFGWTHGDLWGPSARREVPDPEWDGLTPRHALQQLGTEWGRAMSPDLWVRHLIKRAKQVAWAHEGVVVSDVRFQNEIDAIQAAGGQMIRIVRAGLDPRPEHASESGQAGLAGFDGTLSNDSTLDVLRIRAVNLTNMFDEIS